jgi:hypothetical protein
MKMPETSTDTIAPLIGPSAPVVPDVPKQHFWTNPAVHRAALAALAAVPVMLVNSVAFIGQFEFLHTHVPWILPGQVLFAVALESVAVYLAWHAHIAKMANDSSGRIMLSAYLFALVIASMNYSHYAGPHWRPTFMSVGLALMSASSPWLWNVHSRRVSRDKLMARGLLEEKAVRLGATRWTWHPYRSMLVTWLATWEGETRPQAAIAMLAQHRAERAARRDRPGTDRNDGTPGALAAPAQQTVVPAAQPVASITGGATVGYGAPARAINGQAVLTGAATVTGGKRPDLLVINRAVQKLAETPDEQLPSIRAVARDLLGDENQRRLAKQLLDDREAAGQLAESGQPPARQPRRAGATTMIASPAGFAPGGVATSGNA